MNFSVFSSVAEQVFLCLFDEEGSEERLEMHAEEGPYWTLFVEGVVAGQRYGYRVKGPFQPASGHRCSPRHLLLDPYAKAIDGKLQWCDAICEQGDELAEVFGVGEDTAPHVPRSVVVADTPFDWQGDSPPRHAWSKTLMYELHVKGFTARHPAIPEHERGTYLGLAHPAAISHLKSLGVTAVELLPVHHFEVDRSLSERQLPNYWGYATVGYFAPHAAYSSAGTRGQQVDEFKQMVAALHKADIEVILDVVYNHTGEGNEHGATLCFRGLDNHVYYKHAPEARGRYLDHTGCGNTLQTRHPQVLQLILDSLRYWVQEMHVDGFRFDLASALVRTSQWVDPFSAFFGAIQQDPVLQKVKLIAEPWDLGSMGYQVGRFPAHWSEWNGMYRDSMREFWCRGAAGVGEFARRFAGSADVYQASHRPPRASLNFITCHDGFTLRDLNTYEKKRNAANREQSRDGESHNRGWNCGAEGELDEGQAHADVIASTRRRQQRNLLTTLLFSQGVPLLLAGDELGRTQEGNNNAYCQDNELSWVDWENVDTDLLDYVRRATAVLANCAEFRAERWLEGEPIAEGSPKDIAWFRPDGEEFGVLDWDFAERRSLCVLRGTGQQTGLLFLFNADSEPVKFVLPSVFLNAEGVDLGQWRRVLDASEKDASSIGAEGAAGDSDRDLWRAGEESFLPPHTVQVFERVEAGTEA